MSEPKRNLTEEEKKKLLDPTGLGEKSEGFVKFLEGATKSVREGYNETMDAAGKKFEITLHKAKTVQGIQLTLNSDEAVDPNVVNCSIECTRDEALAAGAQLFSIVDEQGA